MALTSVAIISSCTSEKISYPTAPSDDTVDNYFGTAVPDPYRPLENDTSEATAAWVKAENEITQTYLSKIPFRDDIRKRLTSLLTYDKTSLPWKESDGKYYFYENVGGKNQAVLYRSDSIGGEKELFLDPNTLSEDGTVALTGVFQSGNGKYTAYTISRNGSDWTEIYVMDTESKKLLDDHIMWAKFTDAAWRGNGFYYSAYPTPEKGKEFSNANENHQIYYHEIGTPQSDDKLVYSDPKNPLHFHTAYVPSSEDYLFVLGSGEGFGQSIMVKNLKTDSDWAIIEPSQNYDITPVGVVDNTVYLLTSADAPKYRLVAAPLSNPARSNWKEVIPEAEGVLKSVDFAGTDKFLVNYQEDATSHLYLHSLDGKRIKEIEMPGPGTVSSTSSRKHNDLFYSFTSFTTPSSIYSYDIATDESKLVSVPNIPDFNADDYETKQIFYTSSDGTKVPMFLTYKKGIELNGKNPTLLYGYGGFNISLPPSFSPARLLWLENGGVYAQANLRGGGEYGEEWHKAGTQLNKLNVFNDFIAAAEYLIAEGYTSPEYLAIEGGSNGGLLVGATVNLRPDLFKVAIPKVGVMDMMRYHLFTIGWNWAPDYGTSADSKEMADYLLSYSPLHTIKNDGTPYPAILVTTADHDDRVVPAHSFKYAATLQASDTGNAPKLIRIDSNAGHGSGKPTSKVIDENTDVYSFIYHNMGITPEVKK